jgi:hypothetical protein
LGTIKGNIGDQNYASGADLDLSKYRTVSIWCKSFAINFGAAPLRADHVMSQNKQAIQPPVDRSDFRFDASQSSCAGVVFDEDPPAEAVRYIVAC